MTAQVYGWGTTSQGGQLPPALMETDVAVVAPDTCRAAMEAYCQSLEDYYDYEAHMYAILDDVLERLHWPHLAVILFRMLS